MRAAWLLLATMLSTTAVAGPNPDLEKAQRLVADLQYKDAVAPLEAAWKRSGNNREQLLKILELQGVVAATLGQTPKATKIFQQLLTYDFDRKLEGDHPPRVMTPFYEARGRVAEQGKLEAKADAPTRAGGKIIRVGLKLAADPFRSVKAVRFHVRVEGDWDETTVELVKGAASIGTRATVVDWWAELLNERDSTLAWVGSDKQPLHEELETEPVAAVPSPPREVVEDPEISVTRVQSGSSMRPVAYACAGAGLAALIVGGVMGARASSLQAEVDHAAVDGQNRVTGITQKAAYELDAQQRTAATVANALFIGGGLLAAAGVTLFFVGSPSSSTASASLSPAPGGVLVHGSF